MAGAPVKVYYAKPLLPDVSRVLACLYEKDIKFDLIDMYKDQHMTVDILKFPCRASTRGHGPAFEDGETKLFESRAICRYLAETYAERGNKMLLGRDSLERASIEQWLKSEEHSFDPPSWTLVFYLAFAPAMGLPPDCRAREESKKKLSDVLDVYEQRLAESSYLAGNEFSLVDLSHLPNSQYLAELDLFSSRRNVRRWFEDISNRDSWRQVVKILKEVPVEWVPTRLGAVDTRGTRTESTPTTPQEPKPELAATETPSSPANGTNRGKPGPESSKDASPKTTEETKQESTKSGPNGAQSKSIQPAGDSTSQAVSPPTKDTSQKTTKRKPTSAPGLNGTLSEPTKPAGDRVSPDVSSPTQNTIAEKSTPKTGAGTKTGEDTSQQATKEAGREPTRARADTNESKSTPPADKSASQDLSSPAQGKEGEKSNESAKHASQKYIKTIEDQSTKSRANANQPGANSASQDVSSPAGGTDDEESDRQSVKGTSLQVTKAKEQESTMSRADADQPGANSASQDVSSPAPGTNGEKSGSQSDKGASQQVTKTKELVSTQSGSYATSPNSGRPASNSASRNVSPPEQGTNAEKSGPLSNKDTSQQGTKAMEHDSSQSGANATKWNFTRHTHTDNSASQGVSSPSEGTNNEKSGHQPAKGTSHEDTKTRDIKIEESKSNTTRPNSSQPAGNSASQDVSSPAQGSTAEKSGPNRDNSKQDIKKTENKSTESKSNANSTMQATEEISGKKGSIQPDTSQQKPAEGNISGSSGGGNISESGSPTPDSPRGSSSA